MTTFRLPLIGTGMQLERSSMGVIIPTSYFGIVLGLVGLGNGWRVASSLWNLPNWIGEMIMLLAFIVWIFLLLLYLSKWVRHRSEALAEVDDPIQCCFIGLLPVSTLLVALAVHPYSRPAAVFLFMIGAFGTVAFAVWRHGGLWRGGRNPAATTPVLYLPTVAGNFVIAIVAGAFGWTGWGQLFFGAGFFAWIALESIILYRFLVIDELAVPLRPTLGIQLAPPAVGLVAYLSVTDGEPGLFAQMLFGYALLQSLILLRLLPWIREQKFAPSYWAFTFGISALSLGSLRLIERGVLSPATELAPILFVAANLVIGAIAVGTMVLLMRGRLLQQIAYKGTV